MKNRTVLPFAALLALAPFASAQTAQPSTITTSPGTKQPNTRPPNTRPPAQGQMQPGHPDGPRDPAFAATSRLTHEVNGLSQLNKDPKTAISAAQAQKLLPILKGLQGAQMLPAAAATKALTQLEALLTGAQLSALSAQAPGRQQDGRGQGGPAGQSGGSGQGNQIQNNQTEGNQAEENRAQENQAQENQPQGRPGQFGQRGPGDTQVAQGDAAGRPARTPGLNPFAQGRRAQELTALITTLTQTAR